MEKRNEHGSMATRCMAGTVEELCIKVEHIVAEHTEAERIEAEGIKAVHIGAIHKRVSHKSVVNILVEDILMEDILIVNKLELKDIIQEDIKGVAGVGIIRVVKKDNIAIRVGISLVDNYLVAFMIIIYLTN